MLNLVFDATEPTAPTSPQHPIAQTIQGWLDWQLTARTEDGYETGRETMLMQVPVWPSRGVLENWIAEIERLRVKAGE